MRFLFGILAACLCSSAHAGPVDRAVPLDGINWDAAMTEARKAVGAPVPDPKGGAVQNGFRYPELVTRQDGSSAWGELKAGIIARAQQNGGAVKLSQIAPMPICPPQWRNAIYTFEKGWAPLDQPAGAPGFVPPPGYPGSPQNPVAPRRR